MSKPTNRHLWVKVDPPYNYGNKWVCKKCRSKTSSEKRPDPHKLVRRTIAPGEVLDLDCRHAMILHLHNS